MSTTLKVVVTGPFGAGKTTFINAVSDTPVVNTETGVSDESSTVKSNTTVAMDYGSITLQGDRQHDGVELLFFGTPGQARFEFMWRILSDGAEGCVLLVDVSSTDSIAEATAIRSAFRERHPDLPVIVGAGRTEPGVRGLIQVARLAAALDVARDRVIAMDARDVNQCRSLLLSLLVDVFGRLDKTPAVEPAPALTGTTIDIGSMPVAV
ncbi:MAG: GTP-binding protein [Dermatophilaceae bacterium]